MHAIGIDIGGTKIAGGLVDELGGISRFERVPTDASDSAAIEQAIVSMIEELAGGERLPVGVAAPGFIDAGQSTVYYTPNIPWRNHPLRERLQDALVPEAGEFLDLHALLLDDPELLHSLDHLVRDEGYSADYALRMQRNRIAAVFEGMDDAYLRSRIDDIDQVIGRLHAALHRDGTDGAPMRGVAGEILVTDNVAPSELLQWHGQGVMQALP